MKEFPRAKVRELSELLVVSIVNSSGPNNSLKRETIVTLIRISKTRSCHLNDWKCFLWRERKVKVWILQSSSGLTMLILFKIKKLLSQQLKRNQNKSQRKRLRPKRSSFPTRLSKFLIPPLLMWHLRCLLKSNHHRKERGVYQLDAGEIRPCLVTLTHSKNFKILRSHHWPKVEKVTSSWEQINLHSELLPITNSRDSITRSEKSRIISLKMRSERKTTWITYSNRVSL